MRIWLLLKDTWPVVRDAGITGTGLAVIWVQVLSAWWGHPPSDVLLAVGLGLTVPSAHAHVRAVLDRPGAGSSSPPSPPPPSPPPSPPPPEGTGEHR